MTGRRDDYDGDTMRLCPSCRAKVTRRDDQRGRCSECDQTLVSLAWRPGSSEGDDLDSCGKEVGEGD
jgi:ribosomal protein L44E